ncbi:HET-domain-containing protein [Cadophora sp. DSE1049]|nr:HET-domain-containing protein [Cadophora sp. DSE1049]
MSSAINSLPKSQHYHPAYKRLSTYVAQSLRLPERTSRDYDDCYLPEAPPLLPHDYEILASLEPAKKLDVEILKQWIQHCDDEHGNHCRPSINATDGVSGLFVDVEAGCLVAPQSMPTYIALSYVWGEIQPFQTTRENVQILRKTGALHTEHIRSRIPRTIQDAMRLTRSVGQRYLWVDALCIVQDAVDKQNQLDRMGQIYQGATLTIVAAQGEDAGAGIHFRNGSDASDLRADSPGETKDGTSAAQPENLEAEWIHYRGIVASSAWGHRGWTLQELLFSKRLIFFTKQGALWECHCANRWNAYPNDLHSLHPEGLEYPWPPRPFHDREWPDLELYTRTVLDYNMRTLRDDLDITRAFAGVTGSLSGLFVGGFSYGHPILFFDWTLLWQPKSILRRRRALLDVNGTKALPSWSWMSWQGALDLRLWRSIDYVRQEKESNLGVTTTPIVQWHIYSSPEHQKPIAHTDRLYYACRENLDASLPSGWERIPNGGFKHRSDPKTVFAYPIPIGDIESPLSISPNFSLISCRAFRAYLRFGSIYEDRTGGPTDIAIVAPIGKKIGVLRLNVYWLLAQNFRGKGNSGHPNVRTLGPIRVLQCTLD